MPDVVVVGSINQDLVFRVPHLPRPGETVPSQARFSSGGGKGANQAVAAARMGAEVAMVGRVGADSAGETLVEDLKREGVDTSHVTTDAELPTGVALIWVDSAGENSIVVDGGANAAVGVDDIAAAAQQLRSAPVVLTQLETPMEAVLSAADAAPGRLLLNPAPARSLPGELLELVDVLVPNEGELSILAGEEAGASLPHLARVAAALEGPGAVVVTLGGRGALMVSEGSHVHLPAPKVEPIDTTAAGDAFCGTLAAQLAQGGELEESVGWAVAAGAAATTRLGAQDAVPTRDEVARLLGTTP